MNAIAFGSINLDLVVGVPHLPQVGETVIGDKFFTALGGKAANQAVAMAKLGIPVHLVGRIGADDFGKQVLAGLEAAGVAINAITINENTHTGIASIVVDERGDNAIANAAGANNYLNLDDVQNLSSLLPQAKVLLIDLGIPLPVISAAVSAAKVANVTIIIDPAPAPKHFPPEIYPQIDILTPNEIEATQLVGFPVNDIQSVAKAALILREKGVQNVIITLGSQGCYCATPQDSFFIPAIAVTVVDTVAAGDAFNGALAAAIVSGKSFREAVQWGTVAGALSVTKSGAQSSLPDKESFFKLLVSQENY
ncbi:MAG: ribokinase [Oscillatoria sp. PMC 1068.18]|nr:ribokinase [Oscillatoria sp. PMC 1076.18]MEC4990384.1 ribokinase [Oscillatoria sp. PMC 1068.18]